LGHDRGHGPVSVACDDAWDGRGEAVWCMMSLCGDL